MNEPKRPDAFDRAIARLIDGCRLGPGLTPEQQAERRRLRREIEQFERRYPALVAKERQREAIKERDDKGRAISTSVQKSGSGKAPKSLASEQAGAALDESQRSMVAARVRPHYEEEAKERQHAGQLQGGDEGGRGHKKPFRPKERNGLDRQKSEASEQAGAALGESQRSMVAARVRPHYEEEAKERQREGGKTAGRSRPQKVMAKRAEPLDRRKSEASEQAGAALGESQRSMVAARVRPHYEEEAKERQRESPGRPEKGVPKREHLNSTPKSLASEQAGAADATNKPEEELSHDP